VLAKVLLSIDIYLYSKVVMEDLIGTPIRISLIMESLRPETIHTSQNKEAVRKAITFEVKQKLMDLQPYQRTP
jgi:hypothetical protein